LEIALRGLEINNSAKTYGVFLSTGHRGWIIDAIARESAQAFGVRPKFNYVWVSRRELANPKFLFHTLSKSFCDVNVFFHHEVLLRFPDKKLRQSKDNRVYLTHLGVDLLNNQKLLKKLQMCTRIIVQNSTVKEFLVSAEIDINKIFVAYGAVDREYYFPIRELSELKSPYVIIVGDCKPRKRPDILRKVIEALPDTRFLIHGKNWKDQLGYQEGLPPNLQIQDFILANNPFLIRSASAILNVAEIEGGPYPILEALASGTPVASSDSGFASEVVTRESGIIFSISDDISTITRSLSSVIQMKEEVALTDLLCGKLTWKDHGEVLYG